MPALTTPEPATEGPQRWHLRATSIGETVSKLAQIWGGVARESVTPAMSDSQMAGVRGDPHLIGRFRESRSTSEDGNELRIRTRTSVLTLVVVAPALETAERAMAAVSALAARHPSRAIIISPADPDGPAAFSADIFAACQLASGGVSEICTEEILIRTGGELAQHLGTAVAPLLIHDLPVVLWWPDDVPFGAVAFRALAAESDRLLVDSGQFRGDGTTRLIGMQSAIRGGMVIHDIGWMRAMLWRELLAGIFDHPLLTRELSSIRRLRIDIAKPGHTVRLARAASFAGWLAAMLGWNVAEPLDERDDRFVGLFRAGRREIPVEFRPVTVGIDGSIRSAGSLVRVELESSHPRATTRVRVTRQADHLLATADWNGAQVARRAARLDVFDEMPFLAEALDHTGRDRAFERALDRAVKLVGRLGAADMGAPAAVNPGPARAGGPAPEDPGPASIGDRVVGVSGSAPAAVNPGPARAGPGVEDPGPASIGDRVVGVSGSAPDADGSAGPAAVEDAPDRATATPGDPGGAPDGATATPGDPGGAPGDRGDPGDPGGAPAA